MAITVARIANVKLEHFIPEQGRDKAPANGSITINHNTFDVTFNNGRVNAKFTSGYSFVNLLFRWRTKNRLIARLQSQYDSWRKENNGLMTLSDEDNAWNDIANDAAGNDDGDDGDNNIIGAANNIANDDDDNKIRLNDRDDNINITGNKIRLNDRDDDNNINDINTDNKINNISIDSSNVVDERHNPNTEDVTKLVDDCFDKLLANKALGITKVCDNKAVLRAFMTPDLPPVNLTQEEAETLKTLKEKDLMPYKSEKLLKRLGEIATLATIRNSDELINAETCQELSATLKNKYHFVTHVKDTKNLKSEKDKKAYVFRAMDNVLNTFRDIFLNPKADVVQFLEDFTGACLEAKTDEVQVYNQHLKGIVEEAASDETNDLAFSLTREFDKINEDFEAIFKGSKYDDAESIVIKEYNATNGPKNEEDYPRRIQDEIKKLVEKAKEEKEVVKDGRKVMISEYKTAFCEYLKTDGRCAVYDKLFGAKRPVTNISKDPKDGKWVVETLVDKQGNPIVRPLSAFEIDRQYDLIVEMYSEDAILMGEFRPATRTVEEDPTYATFDEPRAEEVLALAKKSTDDAAIDALVKDVKNELAFKDAFADDKLKELVGKRLNTFIESAEALQTQGNTKKFDRLFIDYLSTNGVSGAYYDKMSDRARLAHILARSIESQDLKESETVTMYDLYLHDIDAKAARFASIMKTYFRIIGLEVNTSVATYAIKHSVKGLVHRCKNNAQNAGQYGMYLAKITVNGLFRTDRLDLNFGKRVGGVAEAKLTQDLTEVYNIMRRYGVINKSIVTKAKG